MLIRWEDEMDDGRERVQALTRRMAKRAGWPLDGQIMPDSVTRILLAQIYGCPVRVVDDVVAWRLADL